jgi:hypothetical protein
MTKPAAAAAAASAAAAVAAAAVTVVGNNITDIKADTRFPPAAAVTVVGNTQTEIKADAPLAIGARGLMLFVSGSSDLTWDNVTRLKHRLSDATNVTIYWKDIERTADAAAIVFNDVKHSDFRPDFVVCVWGVKSGSRTSDAIVIQAMLTNIYNEYGVTGAETALLLSAVTKGDSVPTLLVEGNYNPEFSHPALTKILTFHHETRDVRDKVSRNINVLRQLAQFVKSKTHE